MKRQKLQDLRKANGLSREKMARLLDISNGLYYQVEMGYLPASRVFMEKIKANFPEASMDELFFD